MTTKEFLILQQLLKDNQRQLRSIRRHQSWFVDLGANIAGNAVWDGLIWLSSRVGKWF